MTMENIALDIQALVTSDISGSITPEEKIRLQLLMERHPEVRELAAHLRGLLEAEAIDIKKSIPAFERKMFDYINRQDRKRRIIRRTFMSAAACFLCLLVFAIIYNLGRKPEDGMALRTQAILLSIGNQYTVLTGEELDIRSGSKTLALLENANANANATISVPPKKMFKLTLSDGSAVWLNSDSKIDFPVTFAGTKRKVSINGEAYLEVTTDAEKPFIAQLPEGVVKVLGTSFNVNTYRKGSMDVALLSGSVQVQSQKDSILLKVNQAASYTGNVLAVREITSKEVLGWKEDGNITIADASSEDVMEAVQRFYGEKLIIHKSAQGKRAHVSFNKNKDVKDFLKNYAKMQRLTLAEKDGVYHINN
jgi:transmembrane sensor